MSDVPDRLASLSPAKRALFELLKRQQAPGATITPRLVQTPAPLSFAQERLWFLHRLDPDNAAYVVAHGIRFRGALDSAVVERALAHLVARHETLRTTFVEIDGEPRQQIASSGAPALTRVDLSSRPHDIADVAREAFERPFDLAAGPLLRTTHVTVAPDDHLLLFAMHHIIADTGSLEHFVREFATCCMAFAQGIEPRLPLLPVQFADYACWQREWFRGAVRDAQVAYWTKQLAGLEPIELPTDAPRPPVQTFRGRVHRTELPRELVAAIRQLEHAHDTTPFMTLLAGFAAFLSRYTRQHDIVVGSPVANRTHSETADLIGLFANTMVLRVDCGGNPTVADLLARTRHVVLDAHAHQDLPFEQLVELLQPVRDLSRNPLFQVFFVYRRRPRDEHAFGAAALDLPSTTTKFDLTVTFEESTDRLWSLVEYNADLFSDETAARISKHLTAVLAAMAADPRQRVDDLRILSDEERASMLRAFAGATPAGDAGATLPTLPESFATMAAAHPERTAVVAGGTRVSYRELAARSGSIAGLLKQRGIGAESLVGVCLDRTAQLVEAVLGILRAGAAYVPLDPGFPAARLRLMIEDARPAAIVTTSALLPIVGGASTNVIVLDDNDVQRELASAHAAPEVAPHRDQLAYVLYTSGSTGTPKGVQIPHRALANFLASMRREPGLTADDRLLAVTTLSFDIAGLELWLPLTTGATVIIASRDDARDAQRLAELASRERATVLQATPSAWQLLLEGGWRNHERLKVLVGGEALRTDLARALLAVAPEIWNLYGPTETTIWSTLERVRAAGHTIPIGRPITATDVYVLDERFEPVLYGVAGDLFIGGEGVARGYFGRPDLTADRFVPDPHARTPGARMYRTGDVARPLPGGVLEFVGRGDDQIKLRGFRIELGDVEAAAAAHPSVAAAAAAVRSGVDGAPALICWFVPASGLDVDPAALREFLRGRLPDYMVPSAFVAVARLPLTPNGKLDRRALPAPSETRSPRVVVAPRTAAEQQMVDLWREILRLDDIGVDDDFFELGGHSMLAARLVSRVRQAFGVDVPLRALFDTPTAAALARAVSILAAGGSLDALTPALRAELIADAALDPTIVPDPSGADVPHAEPSHVLLTGASGFLGAHLLAELLETTSAAVSCIVRCRDRHDGEERLRDTLKKYRLHRPELEARIVAVPGDLERPRLGLSDEDFDALARNVEAIYHNGALVNFVMPYRRLRAANVAGTTEVLRLACRHAVKPVHYVSTTDVLGAGYLTLREDDPVTAPDGLAHGYAQSKWVAERLVTAARERGVPAAIYRPGRVVGHSRTGIWNTDDFACRAIRGSIELGVVPDVDPIDNMAPVDYVSRAIVAVSRSPMAFAHRAFHVVNPTYFQWRDLFAAMRHRGYALETVPYRDWRRRLASAPDNALAPLLPLFPVPPEAGDDGSSVRWTAIPVPNCAATLDALRGSGVECPALDEALWNRYFDFFLGARYIAPVCP